MPLGASRLNFFTKPQEAVAVEQRTAVTITVNGDAQIDTAQSKFGGSSYLGDGTGDYLRCSNVDSFTGDFTIEGWFRFSEVSNQYHLLTIDGAGTALPGISIWRDASTIKIYSNGANGSWSQIGSNVGTVSSNTWHHIYVSRSGNNYYSGIDGSSTTLGTFGGTISSSNDVLIGALDYSGGTVSYNGWADEIRVSDTARYTTGFTPSTTPFVNDSNTLFLCHADGTDGDTVFIDDNGDRAPVGISAFGNAEVSTAQSKFGNSSFAFDGTGDYLEAPTSDNWDLGTASTVWTIEGWIYMSSLPGAYQGIVSSQDGSLTSGGGTAGWGVYISNTNKLTWIPSGSGGTVSASTAFTAATWQHWAVVRNGTSLKMFLDGSEVYNNASYSNYTDADEPLWIGRAYNIASGYNGVLDFNGYLDEIRISDTARYTTGFTPSTTAFENDSNTLLLLHGEQHDADTTVIFDDNGATLPTYTPPVTGTGLYGIDNGGSAEIYTYGFDNTTTPITVSCYIYFNNFSSVDIIYEDFKNGIPSFQFTIESGRPSLTCKTGSNGYIYQALDTSNTNWPSTGAWYWFGVSVDPSNTSNRAFVYQEVGSSTVISVPIYKSRNNTGTYDTNYFNRDTSIGIGGRGNGGVEIDGAMSDFLVDYGTFVDFTNASTRANWISSTGVPQDWGSDGSTAFGSTPDIFLSGPVGTMDVTNQGTHNTAGGNAAVINKRGTFTDVDGPSV